LEALNVPLGGPNHYVHVGLLDYFAASLSDDPVVLRDIVPPVLQRDLRARVRFPDDIEDLSDLCGRFETAFLHDRRETWHLEYHKHLLQLATDHPSILDGHRSGLVIGHPLWRIRKKLGSARANQLVARAIWGLATAVEHRAQWTPESGAGAPPYAEWYDLLTALERVSEPAERRLIRAAFLRTGYPIGRSADPGSSG
jgi:hypothetical protein